MEERQDEVDDPNRRSFMKKGALASGALALGLGSTSGTAAAQDANQGLVFGYEYNPGLEFEVVNRLQQSITDDVLAREAGDNGRQIVQDPADYNGFVIRYQPDQDASEYAFLFIREGSIGIGERGTLGGTATFFNSEANLLTAGLDADVDSADTTPGETPAPDNETDNESGNESEAVVVNDTEDGDG